jgi:hypothetical protein
MDIPEILARGRKETRESNETRKRRESIVPEPEELVKVFFFIS